MSDYTTGSTFKIAGKDAGRVNLDSSVKKLEDTQCTYQLTGFLDTYAGYYHKGAESDLRVSTSDGQYGGYAEGYAHGNLLQAIDTEPVVGPKQQVNGPKTVTVQRRYGTEVKVRLVHEYFDRSVPVASTFAVKEYKLAARAYELPRPPKSVTAKLRSGTRNTIDVSWVADYDSSTQARPWTGVYVYRYLDGSTSGTLVATLAWSKTSFTDGSVEEGHRVSYGVYSYNSTGKSTKETRSGWVYTCPKAPSSIKVSATEETAASTVSTTYSVEWACSGTASNTWEGVSVQRQLDDGSWVEVKKMPASLFSLKDSVAAGHKIRYRVAGYNTGATLWSDFVYADAVYNAPTPYTAVTPTKTASTTVALTATGGSSYVDSVEWQRCRDGVWSYITLSNGADTSAPTATIRYRARKKKGSLYSAWRESAEVENVRKPLAPVLSCPSFLKSGEGCKVSWTRNHPDFTAQTAAQVRVTPRGGKAETHDVDGAAASYTLTATRTSVAVAVRTKGLSSDWGDWSAERTVVFLDGLSVQVTTPALDYPAGPALTDTSVAVEATVAGEAVYEDGPDSAAALSDLCGSCSVSIEGAGVSQRLTLTAVSTGAVQAEGDYYRVLTSYRGTLENVGGILSGHDYVLKVSAASATSPAYDAEATRLVHTDYPEPSTTYRVDVEVHEADYSASVTVDVPADAYVSGSSLVLDAKVADDGSISVANELSADDGALSIMNGTDIEYVTVDRVDQCGDWETIAASARLGDTVVDRLPPLNVDFSYVVRGYSPLGSYRSQEVSARVESHGAEVYNFGPAAESLLAFELDAESSRDFEQGGEEYRFALGEDSEALPTFYADGSLDVSGSNSYKLHSREAYDRVYRTVRQRANTRFWFRDHWGHRIYAHGKWSLGYSAQSYGLWNVSVNPTQVVWRTPQNG